MRGKNLQKTPPGIHRVAKRLEDPRFRALLAASYRREGLTKAEAGQRVTEMRTKIHSFLAAREPPAPWPTPGSGED